MTAPNLTAYFAKVDARLATVSAATARELLRGEIDRWLDRYAEFQRRVMHDMDTGDVTAFDFVETIAGLDQRLAGYEGLTALRQAIIDHTKGDLFWIGEILLAELEKETGFTGSPSIAGAAAE